MKPIRISRYVVLFLAALLPAWGSCQTFHYAKQVSTIQSPDTRPCLFFQLAGETVADPIVPGNPWFAVSRDHPAYKEITNMLLVAKITSQTVSVYTTGQIKCGLAEVIIVAL